MPLSEKIVFIEGRKLLLSSLGKVMFPKDKIRKEDLVEYYLGISKYMLPHLMRRPLTLIKYPEGIVGEKFYSKHAPEWTPEWINRVHADPENDFSYITVENAASLIWCVNLNALEFHPMQVRSPSFDHPDQIIFDLDPPDDASFAIVKKIACALHDFLVPYGYQPYLKTSGSRGLHIYVPIKPVFSREAVIKAVKAMALKFVSLHNESTMEFSKEKRMGKVFIDIYRNNKAQSCVAPYSVRGKDGAPISTPIFWEELKGIRRSTQFNLKKVIKRMEVLGDPWADFYQSATMMHSDDV